MDLNKITEKVIGCGIEVHRELGAGLLESICESALCIELKKHGLKYERQKALPVEYKGYKIGEYCLCVLCGSVACLICLNSYKYSIKEEESLCSSYEIFFQLWLISFILP